MHCCMIVDIYLIEKQHCPLSRDHGRRIISNMKSQDILLLLKVVSLSQQANQTADQFPENWKNWDLTAVLDEGGAQEAGSAHEAVDEQDGAFSNVAADQPPYDPYSVRGLSLSTGISKSEVSMALKRCYANGLAKRDRHSGAPRVNTRSLCEFIVHGLRYVFPAKPGEVTRGIATGFAAPVLQGRLMSAGELVPVWADARGDTKGLAVEPLFKTAPMAVKQDPTLYAFLALVDAIRLGQPRERKLAAQILETLFKD